MTSHTETHGLPPAVAELIAVVSSIPGVAQAALEKTYLPDIAVPDLALPGAFADLPIAALRRTGGGLEEELLFSLNFIIERNERGLKALEFLSWWVRDQSRSGQNMQLRSIGLPPIIRDEIQLGWTLRFTIDWLYANPSQDMGVALEAIADKARGLAYFVDFYKAAF